MQVSSALAQIPQEWHAQPKPEEMQLASMIIKQLQRAPDFPKVKKWHVFAGAPPKMQINAWERDMQIYLPIEMFRFIENSGDVNDGSPAAGRARSEELAFLLAHEAGHAKQEEIYHRSCYEEQKVKMTKYDALRSLTDIAGAAATKGSQGTLASLKILQQQTCEDHADVWAIRFTQEAGIDANGGVRLFNKTLNEFQRPGWQGIADQFTSGHSINAERVAHISYLVNQPFKAPDAKK